MTAMELDQVAARLEQRLAATMHSSGDSYWLEVRTDVFAIPYLDGFILYSPLQGLSALITRTGLANLLLNEHQDFEECLGTAMVSNRQGSIANDFDTHPFQVPNANMESARYRCFRPKSLTLSLTSACQLACTYCYIDGGDSPRKMPWDIAKASIAFVADSLVANGAARFDVEFHGQGEPTANWPLFQNAVNAIHIECATRNLTPSLSIVTNGILTEEKVEFIADNNIKVGLSLDGLKESTDSQRPLRRSGSSFDRIMQSIHLFKKHEVEIGIRSTVTNLNLGEMAGFTEYLSEQTDVRFVNFEPVCYTGRALRHDQLSESIISEFIHEFRKARDLGINKGVSVAYSAARTDGIRSTFCGAYGRNLNFCVSTEGLVSSCYEVLNSSDQRAALFIYGRFDRATNQFVFDDKVLDRLLNLSVTDMKRCQHCYAKWNCGGDCISKISKDGLDRILGDSPVDRCTANRAITRDDLFRIFLTEEREVTPTTSASTTP